jgi:hypothetical protein
VQYFTAIVTTIESFKREINNFDIDKYENKKTLYKLAVLTEGESVPSFSIKVFKCFLCRKF